jgi:beta-N-acetylhexosaminidase
VFAFHGTTPPKRLRLPIARGEAAGVILRRQHALDRPGAADDPLAADDPSAATVIRYGDAFARGLRAGGIAATAKHFPGFGRARFNTDDRPVVIRASASTLRGVDERPFASVPTELVMISSAIYPALDSRPALLSRRIIGGELRGRIGFGGVTAADNLDGGALTAEPDVAIRAAAAGDDLLLYPRYQSAAHAVETLAKALRSGRLGLAAARTSMARILALRAGLRR